MPGEFGDLFRRWCPDCKHRGISARGLDDDGKRELARNFAARHIDCWRAAHPGEDPMFCTMCGLLLLNDDRCPVHVHERREYWTAELAGLIRDIVDAVASDGHVTWRRGLDQAYAYARLWGMRREPWIRRLPVGSDFGSEGAA